MRNAGLEEAQAGIKIAGRNINNPRYADDTTLMAESEEELKSFLMKVERGEWKSWLKAQYSENQDHGIWPHHFMANRCGNSENSVWLYFGGLQNHCNGDWSHEIKRLLLLGRKVMTNLDSILKSRDIVSFIGRTDAEAETLILRPSDVKNWLIGKDPDAGEDWRWEEKGMTEDEMVGWHLWLNGHEFE